MKQKALDWKHSVVTDIKESKKAVQGHVGYVHIAAKNS